MNRLIGLLLFLTAVHAQPPNDVWVVAHKGFNAVAPENTIAAFDAAARVGGDYMELDVRPTRDGELILMHDAKVDRTTNGKGAVRDTTLADIRTLDAGNGQQVPTFREALLWGKKAGRRIDVDHKDGAVEDVAKVIRETGMTKMVVIEGPRERLARFAELLPGVDTMPKVSSADDIREACRTLHTTVIRLSLEQLEDRRDVDAVHACGARISVTILGKDDNEKSMRHVIELGAQLIETDHPDLVAKVRQTAHFSRRTETASPR
jgi:glycerophosphoryl diester phosphodiesterase